MREKQYLTDRELQVLNLLTEGLTNEQIAERLFVSVHTVKANLENMFLKCGVHNRIQMIIWALKNDIIDIQTDDF